MRLTPIHLAAAALLAATVTAPAPVVAQVTRDAPARNAAYIEIGGPGGLYSLNADRRAGASVMTIRGGATNWATNVDLSRYGMRGVFAGAGRNWNVSDFFRQGPGRFIETSAVLYAGTFQDSRGDEPARSGTLVMVVPSAGLRYQPIGRGWMIRAVLTPFLPLIGEMPIGDRDKPSLGAGVSFGYAW